MKIQTAPNLPASLTSLILPFYKSEVYQELIQEHSGIRQVVHFTGKFKEIVVLHHPENNLKVFLLGLGESADHSKVSLAFRSLFHHQAEALADQSAVLASHLPEAVLTEVAIGAQLATYHLGRLKTKSSERVDMLQKHELTVVHPSSTASSSIEQGECIAASLMTTMHLVDTPSNIKTPSYIAETAIASGKTHGFKVNVLGRKELEEHGLGALLAVGQGSRNEPVLVEMEYKPEHLPEGSPTFGLVGKGISFDTGGISIKNSSNMHFMKCDMGGAGAVLGAIELAASLQLPVHIVGVLACAENMVDANSFRPGDVITSYSGKTIEIIDTDAEGRLVLADGLAWILKHHQPTVLLDMATLTGSAVQTLGYHAAALFTNNEDLAEKLATAGQSVHNRLWRLPLWKDYEDDLHSDVADVKNFSGKPVAGAISAAKFLEAFTEEHTTWAHIDIAGVAFGDSEFSKMRAATGFGVRLLVEFMKDYKK